MKNFPHQIDFVTSDTHFCHANVLNFYPDRPGETIEEHDAALIERWNSIVQPGQWVAHLGDFSYKGSQARVQRIRDQLNGNLLLILGNHDQKHPVADHRTIIETSARVRLAGCSDWVYLNHFPYETWAGDRRGVLHLHGHCHGALPIHPEKPRRLDVGCDYTFKYTGHHGPVGWDVLELMLDDQKKACEILQQLKKESV